MTVLAHGVGQSPDLPLPLDLVLQAGAATVVVSFLVVAVWWKQPRLTTPVPERPAPGRSLRFVVLAAALYFTGNAFLGPPGPANPAAHALFVWLWVGLVPVSIVFGPVWRAVNPLRTVFRLLRLPAGGLWPVPVSAGRWPAAIALLAFVWFELVAPHRGDPAAVGSFLLGYAAVQLALATMYGEEWFAGGDCFEVTSTLAGRLHRNPLAGIAQTADGPGLAAFLAVWWGSTIFDSASGLVPTIRYGTAVLLALCGLVLVSVRVLARRLDVTASLIPIAVGYTLAHYASLLLVEAPRGVLLTVQQWGLADDAQWDFVPAAGVLAMVQVTLILAGHVLGVVVAHDKALTDGPQRPALATLADELPVVLLMIGYTWAGLFLLLAH
ncbi:hypothetical protein [Actinoplanes sp. NPDC049599]|uniref:hypothetical protein n=1 Tax=Actinoplanes sp. NPDC049599 TaxID=3363903 RepID=UPI00378BE7A8